MKLTSLISALVISAGVAMTAAPAQARRPIRERIARQQERIREGVASGELSPGEASRLERRLQNDARHFRRSRRSGGDLSGSERDRIQDELDRNSDRIKHDRSNRDYYGGYRYNNSYRYSPYWRY